MYEIHNMTTCKVVQYTDPETGNDCILHIYRTEDELTQQEEIAFYEVYLEDYFPCHDFLLKIYQGYISESEFITEEELLDYILDIIEDDLQEGFEKYDEIIMSCFPTCDECFLCDDSDYLDFDDSDEENP